MFIFFVFFNVTAVGILIIFVRIAFRETKRCQTHPTIVISGDVGY